ncbi:hypothetical protein LCGC14_0745880 [marine sediment metagenome]|uniref:Rhodanese domain-containing protein n=1 Tax=marine sediment metagenome TaxID=412755 RepID=A0A0F9Q9M6_9ZZZZ|nr:hypothetical protein [archaeon]HEC38303.1 hypothetical protein [bacterium]
MFNLNEIKSEFKQVISKEVNIMMISKIDKGRRIRPSNLSAEELNHLIETNREKVLIIDVRSSQEYSRGHIKGAKSIPFKTLKPDHKYLENDKEKKIVMVCNGGGLSTMAAITLSRAGFTDVNNLNDGMFEWVINGYPVVIESIDLKPPKEEEVLEINLESTTDSKILDATGKLCPIPVIWTKKAIKTMAPGETLKLIADDVGSLIDIPALLKKTGDELLNMHKTDSEIEFTIKKKSLQTQ